MSDVRMAPPRWADPVTSAPPPDYVGDHSGTYWTVEVARTDGEHARILTFDSCDGGLVVILSGSAGADIEVNEVAARLRPWP